jgi:hypothetical protein
MEKCEVAVRPICRPATGQAENREVGKEGKNNRHLTEHPNTINEEVVS